MCVALPGGTKAPSGGVLLGSAPGGSLVYVEPAAAVAMNNELGGCNRGGNGNVGDRQVDVDVG